MKRFVTAGTLIAALALPVAAQNGFNLPAGCTANVTMQKRGCVVTHLFSCAADQDGYQRRVDLDEEGMRYLGVIDDETQWIESFNPRTGITSALEDGANDPASLSDLIATGTDTFDFITDAGAYGRTRHVGEDTLTGEMVEIDGVTLQRTTFQVRAFDMSGALQWEVAGTEFISADWRTFLSGRRIVTNSSETFESDETPVEFAFPGEDGFLAQQPKFDCGVVLSSFEVTQ